MQRQTNREASSVSGREVAGFCRSLWKKFFAVRKRSTDIDKLPPNLLKIGFQLAPPEKKVRRRKKQNKISKRIPHWNQKPDQAESLKVDPRTPKSAQVNNHAPTLSQPQINSINQHGTSDFDALLSMIRDRMKEKSTLESAQFPTKLDYSIKNEGGDFTEYYRKRVKREITKNTTPKSLSSSYSLPAPAPHSLLTTGHHRTTTPLSSTSPVFNSPTLIKPIVLPSSPISISKRVGASFPSITPPISKPSEMLHTNDKKLPVQPQPAIGAIAINSSKIYSPQTSFTVRYQHLLSP